MFSRQDELKSFREDGIFNYSTMLMRDDLGLLLLGAREAIYALDMDDITVKKTAVRHNSKLRKMCQCTPHGLVLSCCEITDKY